MPKLLVLVLTTGALVSHPLRGLAAEPQAEARQLLREGNQLYRDGSYQGALEKFQRAKALHPSPRFDTNIGTTLNALKRYSEAAEHYERFLLTDKSARPEMVQEVRRLLEELQRKLGRVELSCRVSGASVAIDGKPTAVTPVERPIYLSPGDHSIAVSKAGFTTFERKLAVGPGEHRRFDVPWTLPSPSPSQAPPPPPSESPSRRRKTILAYSVLAVAGACAAGAAVLYGVGRSQAASAHEEYLAAVDPIEIERHRNEVESGKKLWVGGHVLVGVGAAALGVAIFSFATRPSERPVAAGVTPRAQIVPLTGGVIVGLRGSY